MPGFGGWNNGISRKSYEITKTSLFPLARQARTIRCGSEGSEA